VILLEIVSGLPIWLPVKSEITTSNSCDHKTFSGIGVFGFKERSLLSIMKSSERFIGTKKMFLKNLNKIDKYNLSSNQDLTDLMFKMMDTNPKNRISPQ
jgi:hypothetical protein